mmetsp:Transcript_130501/g.278860  ORF Transcript_130501/g.278860 Transcript_130501/m.278860 type:complete len:221 (-) Transcript_130501:2050-2712(-)
MHPAVRSLGAGAIAHKLGRYSVPRDQCVAWRQGRGLSKGDGPHGRGESHPCRSDLHPQPPLDVAPALPFWICGDAFSSLHRHTRCGHSTWRTHHALHSGGLDGVGALSPHRAHLVHVSEYDEEIDFDAAPWEEARSLGEAERSEERAQNVEAGSRQRVAQDGFAYNDFGPHRVPKPLRHADTGRTVMLGDSDRDDEEAPPRIALGCLCHIAFHPVGLLGE